MSTLKAPARRARVLSRSLSILLTTALASALALTAGIAPASAADAPISATALQTSGRTNPLGIGTDAPTLSWQSAATGRGVMQTAYEVRVSDGANAESGNAWETGKVTSDDQLNIVYGGSSLKQQTRYHWQVKVWDNRGNESAWSPEAWFETGVDIPVDTSPKLYTFDSTTEGWDKSTTNISSVDRVTSIANGPGTPQAGAGALSLSLTGPGNVAKKAFVVPATPIDLTDATEFYANVNSYGWPQVNPAYKASITLFSGTDSITKESQYTPDAWNRIAIDVSDWANRSSVTRIEISFVMTGQGAEGGFGGKAQIDSVGYSLGDVAPSDFTGDWISAPAGDPELAKWTDYTMTTNFSVDNLVLGVYFRASDINNAYMWQLSVSDGSGKVKFRPHKKINGGFSLLEDKDISSTISVSDFLSKPHSLAITVDGSTITSSLDGTVFDTRTDTSRPSGYIGFRQSTAAEGIEKATIHSVNVTSKSGVTLFDSTFDSPANPFTAGRVSGGNLIFDTPTETILDKSRNLPIFRTKFAPDAAKTVTSARVYAAARGVYELSLNGEKVGDQHLAPGWTDYNSRIQYQTYDVTDQVKGGENAFGAMIAPGWFSGQLASFGSNHYGNTPSLLAQLRIDYSDGSHDWVVTNGDWKTTSGPIKSSDLLNGETWDASAELAGWNTASFDDSAWAVPAVQPTATDKLVPQEDEPVRELMQKPALVRTQPTTGTYIYDLGQNMVGSAHLKLSGTAGSTATIRYGEVLNPDGSLYTANLRSAKATDRYTFRTTGTEVYEPKFTFHGYRYIEVTGVQSAPALADITGLVWGSDLDTTGSFESSNPMLNQLQSNITWGQRGNFLSIPTDTPARDERLGWTGDINVFAPTASYNSDSLAFLTKWLADLRRTQGENGDFPGVAPRVSTCCDGGTGWADAGITVPYALWKAYGDKAVVHENWASMSKFMDFMITSAGADLIQDRGGYLDWLNLDDATPAGVLGTAYFAEDARMLSEMAASIGQTAKADQLEQLSSDIRTKFAATMISSNGTVSGNSQAGYAIAIGMGMVPADKLAAVGDKFVAKVAASNYHLTTGFLGTPWLLPALTKSGHQDVAYRLLLNDDYPSWGYEIAKGATTVWERWNSIMPDGSFGDVAMNSFNHYAYGAVGTWMYENIGGISPVSAGYKTFSIAPTPGGGLTSGTGSFDSVYGTISSDWKTTAHGLSLDVTVPVNTTATLRIPAGNGYAVSEGGSTLAHSQGVSDVAAADGYVTATLGSGTYAFTVDDRAEALGSIYKALDAYSAEVSDRVDDSQLSTADAAHLQAGIDGIRGTLDDAIAAVTAGQPIIDDLYAATDAAADLREWLAASTITTAARAALSDRNDAVEFGLGSLIATQLGVSLVLPPVATEPLPGDTVSSAVEVTNGSSAAISDVAASVSIGDWKVDPESLSKSSVVAGGSAALAFDVAVPETADSGAVAATLTSSFTSAGHLVRQKSSGPWARVASAVTLSDVTASANGATGTVTATLTNDGHAGVAGRVALTLPDGWAAAPASADVTVPAGGSVTVSVPFFVPLTVDAGSNQVGVAFVRGSAVLDSTTASLAVSLATPPASSVDHVDLGDSASENAHGIMGSPSSGTNTEAGLTRRYSNATTPGSWFSYTLAVTPNKPFILRFIETYDGAATKKYDILVNDTLVHTRVHQRTQSGQGTQTAQVLIPDDGTLTSTGVVRIKMLFTTEPGFHDPSIADAWTIDAPANVAPIVAANVSSDAPTGSNGWVRGDASVAITATDDSGTAPSIEYSTGTGFAAYTGPVAVTSQGESVIDYRAVDAAGATSGEKHISVRVDSVAPVTEVAGVQSTVGATRDQVALDFTATDATSGVASTSYRVDGGKWKKVGATDPIIEGFGEHAVEFFSTDVAGNPESPKSTSVSVTDVATLSAFVHPAITGTAKVGSTLTASTGEWNTNGLSFTYRWLRNGADISGAVGNAYVVNTADAGKKISVRITASKPGFASAAATSASTSVIAAVTALKNTSKPVVSGSLAVRKTLTVSVGKWNLTGLSYTYQWQRDGKSISGATAKSYKITATDAGSRMSVRVGASKAGYSPVYATSAKSKAVAKLTSTARISVDDSSIKRGKSVIVTAGVTVSGLIATGKAYVYDGSKKVATITLASGRGAVAVKLTTKGSHKLSVTYAGNSKIAADKSSSTTVRVS